MPSDELTAGALAILCVAAFATSVLSAVVGMAGGITLLAVMLLFLDPLVVIPVHGAIQLVSNSSRAVIQRDHLRWDIIARYGALLLPMGFVGLLLVRQLPPEATKAIIGAFVLLATWRPNALLLGTHPERSDPGRRFFVLGGAVGLVNIAIGATGPLIAPFFLGLGLDRFELIGTKPASPKTMSLARCPNVWQAALVFDAHWLTLATMIPMVVAGTWAGSRLLHRVSEAHFVVLYKSVLTLIALRLVIGGLL